LLLELICTASVNSGTACVVLKVPALKECHSTAALEQPSKGEGENVGKHKIWWNNLTHNTQITTNNAKLEMQVAKPKKKKKCTSLFLDPIGLVVISD